MLRVWRAHHPYADFFFFFLADAFLDCACHEYKNTWRKTSLLACCLRLVYWLKVDSKSLHFVEKRPAVSIDIELERFRDVLRLRDREHVPRPAAKSLSVVHQSGAASRSCAVRAQKKWRRHDEHSGRTSKELEEETRRWKKILFAVFDELFVENLGSSVGKCVLAARDRCWGDVCAVGRVDRKLLRFSVVFVIAIR